MERGIPATPFQHLGRRNQTGPTESHENVLKRYIWEDTVAMHRGTNRDHIDTIPNLMNQVADDNNWTPFMVQQRVNQWRQNYQEKILEQKKFQKKKSDMMLQFGGLNLGNPYLVNLKAW